MPCSRLLSLLMALPLLAVAQTAETFQRHLVLYPDHLAVTIEESLPEPAPGEYELLLPIPPEAGVGLEQIIGVLLPSGASMLALHESLGDTKPWPALLEGESLGWFSDGSWQQVTVEEVLPGGLLIRTGSALRLIPKEQWHNLRFPLELSKRVMASKQSARIQMRYKVDAQLADATYQVRYAYRPMTWKIEYWLRGDEINAFLQLQNQGEMAVKGASFELVPISAPRPLPRRVVMADEAQMTAAPIVAVSEMGQRRYRIEHSLTVEAEESKMIPLATMASLNIESYLLLRDQLFGRLPPNQAVQRQLLVQFPAQVPALPAGRLTVLAEDGAAKLAEANLAPIEPGDEQKLTLGPSPLVSVKKQFLEQDRQSAKFMLTFINHSAEPQVVEYWLQGVKQVNDKNVPASEGYRISVELPPRGSQELTLQGWRETP